MTSNQSDQTTLSDPRVAADASMRAVESSNKQAWLDLFAPDGTVEDPIGPSPMDPQGNGHTGRDAIGAFWDANIAGSEIRFHIDRSYRAGPEVANVGSITIRRDGMLITVEGVFCYCVDHQGKLRSLRAFWNADDHLRIDP